MSSPELRRQNSATEWLEWCALIYLVLPAGVYSLGFLNLSIGLALAGFALVTLAILRPRHRMTSPWPAITLGCALLAAICALVVAGFPSGPYSSDWIKHWALIRLLSTESWPVRIELVGFGEQWFRFYFGAYLVPAFASKLSGAPIAVTTAVWYGAGILLLSLLVQAHASRLIPPTRASVIPFALLLIGGADGVALQFFRWLTGMSAPAWYAAHSEAWANILAGIPLQYSSIIAQLAWVPHQAIAAALATMLVIPAVVHTANAREFAKSCVALGALTLHSPYAAIGLAPFVLTVFLRANPASRLRSEWRAMLVPMSFGVTVSLVVFFNLRVELPAGSMLCLGCMAGSSLVKIMLFLMVELGPILLLLKRADFQSRDVRIAVLILVVLPFFGSSLADPVMRISMPALLVLAVRAAESLASLQASDFRPFRSFARWIIAPLLVASTSIGEIGYHVSAGAAHRTLPANDELRKPVYIDFARSPKISVVEFLDRSGWNFRSQYFSATRPPLYKSK